MRCTRDLTCERLKELFSYSRETGEFTRIKAVSAAKPGTKISHKDSKGHIQVRIDGCMYSGHRLAWLYVYGEWPKGHIDHINGIRSDNRIANLRDVTITENAQNIRNPRINNKTGLLGVSWKASAKKYVAQIQIHGKVKYLGLFSDPHGAHEAYLQAKREHHAGCTI